MTRGPEWCEELRAPHLARRLLRRARRAGVELSQRDAFVTAWRCLVARGDALSWRPLESAPYRAELARDLRAHR